MGTVLITGTSVGIGLAAAVEIARRGERVFAAMRDTSRRGDLDRAAAEAGVDLDIVEMDVSSTESVNAAVQGILAECGQIDVVVNNAAFATQGPIEFMTDEDLHLTFDTNIAGPIRVIRAVLPSMRARRKGRIINISSQASSPRIGLRLWGIYGASKAALSALTLELCKEVAPLGIEVVLMEAVGGKSRMNAEARERAARLDLTESPYAFAEKIFQVHWDPNAIGRGPEESARMIADACTAEKAPIRYTPEAHAVWDDYSRVSDEDFMRLAALDPSPELYQKAHMFWQANKVALAQAVRDE